MDWIPDAVLKKYKGLYQNPEALYSHNWKYIQSLHGFYRCYNCSKCNSRILIYAKEAVILDSQTYIPQITEGNGGFGSSFLKVMIVQKPIEQCAVSSMDNALK